MTEDEYQTQARRFHRAEELKTKIDGLKKFNRELGENKIRETLRADEGQWLKIDGYEESMFIMWFKHSLTSATQQTVTALEKELEAL